MTRAALTEAAGLVDQLNRVAGAYDEDVDPNVLSKDPEFICHQKRLVDCVVRLNAAVNPGRQRCTFGSEMLQEIERVVEESLAEGTTASPAFQISAAAVGAWDSVVGYIFQMRQRVHDLSFELCWNRDLVRLLAAWESSWAFAAAYVVDPSACDALHGLVGSVRDTQNSAPGLTRMLGDRGEELFLVLPRLIWLRFLDDPVQMQPLLKPLIPHRFRESSNGHRGATTLLPDRELAGLMKDYRLAWNLILSAAAEVEPKCERTRFTLARAALASSAVAGPGAGLPAPLERVFESPVGCKAKEMCKSFLNKLEGWSMELQRHHAKDWNRFIALLLWEVDEKDKEGQ